MGSVRMKLGLTHPPLKRYQIATAKPILVILFLKCSLECGRLHFNLYEVIGVPQQPLYPDSGKLTLNCIILNTESPSGATFSNLGFEVHNNTLMYEFRYKIC